MNNEEDYINMFSFENVARMMDNLDEARYGVRPRGTKRVIEPTVQELTISEMVGMPVKIKHD